MLKVWALLLCVVYASDAGSQRRPQSPRHIPAPPALLLLGHAPQTRLPHSHNSATRTPDRPTTTRGFRKASTSTSTALPLSSRALLQYSSDNSGSTTAKETHLFFLRLKPNKAVPAVSTTTPKPTQAPIFIIKSTPQPGEPPVFIVKTTPRPTKPPVPWRGTQNIPNLNKPNLQRPHRFKPGKNRPAIPKMRPWPAFPPPPSNTQTVHYHSHYHSPLFPPPLETKAPHVILNVIEKKPSAPPRTQPTPVRRPPQNGMLHLRPKPGATTTRLRPRPVPSTVRPRPQFRPSTIRPAPQQSLFIHQHLHQHLIPAAQIIIRKRIQDAAPPRRPFWNIF